MQFSTLVNIEDLKQLCEDFTAMTGMVTAILDLEGNILIATGWQDICTCFHRVDHRTAALCRESDTVLAGGLKKGEKVNIYKCKNGLVDVAVPIKVHGVHVANFFTGQFFLEPPDREFFIRQAKKYGFDREAYLAALSRVPVLTHAQVQSATAFFTRLAQLFGEMGLAKKELEEANESVREEAKHVSESEKRFRTLIDTISDLIWLKNAEGIYLSCNQGFERFFGVREGDIVGKSDCDFVPREQAEFFRELDRKAMAAGAARSDEQWVTFAEKGQRTLLYTTKTPMSGADGTFIGVLGVSRDITALRDAEDERVKLKNQLYQAQKIESIGQLAGGVAHDFNNMLGVIIGRAELALRKLKRAKPVDSDLSDILKAARHSAELTRQLLTFARKQTILPEILDLNETIAGMLNILQRIIGENIRLSWHPEPNLWPVMIDHSQLDQILTNLCVNARDAIANIGKIEIKTAKITFAENHQPASTHISPGDYILLTVGDDGCGMDKETLDHIFEPFFTTKRVGKGTGLGLSTVYGAVKQNNGFIEVASEVEKGTVVNIYLPRSFAQKGSKKERTAASPRYGSETILLVEDDKMLLQLTTTLLEENGYKVLAAATPDVAQSLANKHQGPIHLLLSDMIMPGMNGKELSVILKTQRPDMKIIFMSGYSADIISSKGVLDEGIELLQKPVSHDLLMTKMREILDGDDVNLG